jgi:hypothetical protein
MGIFAPPDLSSATNKTQAKALLDAATELYNKTREDHEAEVAAIIARHVKSCDLHAKEYQAIATNFEQEKESVMSLLSSQFLGDARLSLWIHILPSLGIAHHKIQDTVPFANPAELVYALEQAIYRDRDGEKLQLQLQFWQASLSMVILCVFTATFPSLARSWRCSTRSQSGILICVPCSSRVCLMIFFWTSRLPSTTTRTRRKHSTMSSKC